MESSVALFLFSHYIDLSIINFHNIIIYLTLTVYFKI